MSTPACCVLVTGASRGAGAAIAKAVAANGSDVVLHYSSARERAEAVAEEIGARAIGLVQADFSEPGAAASAWAEAETLTSGRLDALVLNHGVFEAGAITDDDELWRANWRRTLQIDLMSAADLAREAARAWVDAPRSGAIIAIASRAAQRGDDADHPAYAAAKAGLTAMMKTMARAYSGRGLLAYTIAPGWIDTEMAPQSEADRARAHAEIPLGRMAQPDEIGALAAFLLSGGCASATGSVFDVNGASHVR
ncbi:MAG: SDR family oxidoreductase [Pseudomonadota bacterium]